MVNRLQLLVQKHKLIILGVLGLLLTACANEVAPTGGTKDTQPPKLKRVQPGNNAVNFAGNKVVFLFDEFIGQGGFSRTLVSPPLLIPPKFRVEGKKLAVILPQPLAENTTYTINFADDLKDHNEGNPILNFNYVFSTGEKIDSQSIKGSVTDAYSGEPMADVVVMLHPRDSTDGFLTNKPQYFAITGNDGNYQINYIKAAEYELFALKDNNLNYLYDLQNEMIGFAPSKVVLFDSLPTEVNLNVFEAGKIRQKLIEKTVVEPGYIQLLYDAPVKKVFIKTSLDSSGVFAFLRAGKDTLDFWYANPYAKQINMQIIVNDTLQDSLSLKLTPIKFDSTYKNGIKPFIIDNQPVVLKKSIRNTAKFSAEDLYGSFKIFFPRPYTGITDSDKAILVTNDTTKLVIPSTLILDTQTRMFAEIFFPKEEETSYTVKVPDGIFTDLFGTTNDSATFHLRTKKKDDYGMLKLKVITSSEKNRIIQLIEATGKKVDQELFVASPGTRVYSFKNLVAGSYQIKVIDDTNKNGVWDTGDFKTKQQPEKVTIYKNLPELKGGWEAEFELKLD